jgi:hypothetical protein
MPDTEALLNDPNYINANPATKRALFDQYVAPDPAYKSANPKTQEALRAHYGVNPDNSLNQWAGVINNAVAPYAVAAGMGAAAGAPFAGVGAVPGAAAGMGSLGLTDLATGGYNLVGGMFGAPRMTTGSEMIRNTLRPTGMTREPETGAQRLVSAGIEGATGAGAGARVFKELAPFVQSPLVRNTMRTLGENPIQQTFAGLGGAVAPAAAQEAGVTNPYALTALGVGGAVLGGKGGVSLERAGGAAQQATQQAIDAALGRGPRTQAAISAAFDNATQSGLRYASNAYNTFLNDAETALTRSGYHPGLSTTQGPITELLDVMRQAPAAGDLTIDQLHTLRQNIGAVRKNPNPDIRRMAGVLTDRLDGFISSPNAYSVTAGQIPADVQQEFRGAITDQNRQFKSQELTRLIDNAGLMKGNDADNLRSQFSTLARNPARMRRFTPDEQDMIRQVATSKGDVLGMVGSLTPGMGQKNVLADLFHAVLGGAVGAATHNPYIGLATTAATGAAAGGANAVRNAMVMQNAKTLAGQVRRGNVMAFPQYSPAASLYPATQAAVNANNR